MKTLVISAFPCSGASFCTEHMKDQYHMIDVKISDFRTMKRQPTEEEAEEYGKRHENTMLGKDYFKQEYLNSEITVQNPDFTKDLTNYIKENLGKVDVIFVSSDMDVRRALQDAEIEYLTVYPDVDLIEEYIGRMYLRGDTDPFIKLMAMKWEDITATVDSQPHGMYVYRLKPRQYMTTVLEELVAKYREPDVGIKDVIVPDPTKK